MRFIKPSFILILVLILIILAVPGFSYSNKNTLTGEEIANLLSSLPEETRDIENKVKKTNQVSNLFAYSISKIAAQNFKQTKYVLEKPEKNVKTFLIIFNQKSASTDFPINNRFNTLTIISNNLKAIFFSFLFVILLLPSSNKNQEIRKIFLIRFHFLIPLRI